MTREQVQLVITKTPTHWDLNPELDQPAINGSIRVFVLGYYEKKKNSK
jgi:hypothetical protein